MQLRLGPAMTIALRVATTDRRPAPVRPSALSIAQVELFDDMRRAEPHWRALERQDALATPYQRFDFLEPWQREVGRRAGRDAGGCRRVRRRTATDPAAARSDAGKWDRCISANISAASM